MKLEHIVQQEELFGQLYIGRAGSGNGSAQFDPRDRRMLCALKPRPLKRFQASQDWIPK